ncbi:quinol-cytochrome oxidoreductase complex cytochrome b subunit [Hydrogenivirga caldilitoris]|uniref:Quinol-cytochrome oxidoreductase complex cytochrome b subunit n=1 Tax=Hydrogenivirga caldilitoris TaxID=246264 RepID=A0A497XVK6_9AQUI|nr:cytochrome b N-terminal domain-containing protein [Hydrogenivirga caldilitoris]RLJ70833.1 quinol-cytochrome oxidoreductase complex cytochrome b subunit [Hydrogenivirga caldilitoris]
MATEIVTISPTYRFMQRLSYALSAVYSSKLNPIYYLGAITVFLLIIDVISGIYLFLFYKVDPKSAYQSVEAISSSPIGSLMRGVHRYSSDGLILFAVLHMLHMILTDRFRMFRWVAWVSGVGTLLIFIVIGLSGYLLVWDERAQLTGLLTAKFFSVIPIFGHALMSAFLGTDVKNLGGLFRILLFGHIAITILLIFTLWVHVMRISRPRLFPPRYLMILLTLYTVVIAVIFPAKSDPPADLGKVPFSMSLDWFYLTGLPLFKVLPLSLNWVVFVGFFGLLAVFPWLIRGRRNPAAAVIEDKCEGCKQCFEDCPYEAIYMKRVSEKEEKAVVIEDKCAGCGICVASCNYSASVIPTVPYDVILKEVESLKPELLVFRCPFGAEVKEREGIKVYTLPCAGALNAVWIKDYLKHTNGVLLVSCDGPDCYFREGVEWTEERFTGKRRPRLLKNVERGRVRVIEAPNVVDVSSDIDKFLQELRENRIPEDVTIISRGKLNHILAPVILFIPFLSFYPLTTHRIDFYPADKALSVITFKYRSSPVRKGGKAYSKLKHMQAMQNIAVERSPIEVTFLVDGKPLLKKKYDPRGLRKDASIYVYEEFLLQPGEHTFELKVIETENPDKTYTFRLEREVKPATSLAITYHEEKGFFTLGGM